MSKTKSKILTKIERETFDFIKKFYLKNGYGPSYKEIGEHFGVASTDTVWKRIDSLKHKGYLIRTKNAKREYILVDVRVVLDFIRNFNPRLFNHPKRYKNLIELLKEYKEVLNRTL